MSDKSLVLEAARQYCLNGLSVIPVQDNKRPIGSWRTAHSSPLLLNDLEKAFAGAAGVAIAPGCVSGNLVILDFDGDDWEYMYNQFIEEWPTLGTSRQVISARRRRHIWLRFLDTEGIGYTGYSLAPAIDAGVEMKANSGYIVAPPSKFTDDLGRVSTYSWLDSSAPIQLVEDSVDLLKWMRRSWQRGKVPEKAKAFFEVPTLPGDQNVTMAYVAQQLRDARFPVDEAILSIARQIRQCPQNPGDPWTETQVREIVESTYRQGARETLALTTDGLHDRGNADLFVKIHPQELKFVPEWGRWLAWDGTHWDGRNGAWAFADWADDVAEARIEQGRLAIQQAGDDPKVGRPFFAEAKQLKNRHSIGSLEWALQSHPAVRTHSDVLDRKPYMLNVTNGTLDLLEGTLRHHDRTDMISVAVPVEYHADGDCPRWHQFLRDVFQDESGMIDFIQRAVGYTLTGDTSEQCFFYLYGLGRNGKSTLLNVLEALLGDLATWTNFSTFLLHSSEGVRNDLAELVGKRLVIASEPPLGTRMDESLVKQLTGGDRVKARFLFHEFFSYRPQYKIWLAANHKVEVRDSSDAYWRRIRLIPFKQSFAGREDPYLLDKLLSELEGILVWAVEGARRWREDGLHTPQSVVFSTADYRKDSDPIGRFMEDEYTQTFGSEEPAASVYIVYRQWAELNGEEIMSSNMLGRRLREKGIEKRVLTRNGSTSMYYLGLRRGAGHGLKVTRPASTPTVNLEQVR